MNDRHPGVSRVGRAPLFAFVGSTLLSSLLLPAPVHADDSAKIAWRSDLGQAQEEARSRDQLLWIQFTGPWCGNCRRMEQTTFAHAPIVVESRERFVPVKLRSDEHESLAQNLGLSVLPSSVIVRPNGEIVAKFEGYGDPVEFAQFLADNLHREGRSAAQVAARTPGRAEKDSAVALAGYDPVTLLTDQKLVPGRPDLAVEHDGRVFRFSNEAGREAFLRKPDSFAPVNGGRCPVSQVDRGDFLNGDPRWGVVYHGHLYLFKDRDDRDRFAKDPERYAGVDRSARPTCPHCRERSTLARRMASRFSTMFATQDPHGASSSSTSLAPALPQPSMSDRLAGLFSLDSVLRR